MRALGTLILALILTCNTATAQDTLYIYKSGIIVSKRAVAEIDSVIFKAPTPTLKVPVVTTNVVSAITETSATCGGNITTSGGAIVTARGVCWSTAANPTTANSKTTEGAGVSSFTSAITGLTANTTYYVRAYATNSAGTGYGSPISFTTQQVVSNTVTDIDGNVYHTVTIGTQVWMVENLKTTKYRDGSSIPNVTDDGQWRKLTTGAYCNYNNDAAIGTKYGKLYNWYAVNDSRKIAPTGWHVPTDAEWTTLENYVSANLGTSGSIAKALASKTDWASSTDGGAIGNDLTKNNTSGFTALPGGERYDGTFNSVGNYGSWWSSTTFYAIHAMNRYLSYGYSDVGIYAENNMNSGFSVRCVRDAPSIPTVITTDASNITTISAICGGNIDGGFAITERGICYSTSQNPTISNSKMAMGSGGGTFSNTMTDLSANTTYYVRAYATNSFGTGYGNEISFKTFTGTVTDIDGNVYHTVTIGTQVWMVENLKTTKYRDGSPIPNVPDNTPWGDLTTGAYCNYNNDAAIGTKYGKLYNWYAVHNSRNIAPAGWHVPTYLEWNDLKNYVHDNLAGSLAKALASKTDWASSTNGGAIGNDLTKNNPSGFTALPGGYRYGSGPFVYLGSDGSWWSSTESSTFTAWYVDMGYGNTNMYSDDNGKGCGFSVRCVRDL